LGAIKQWIELQEENDCIYCIVDLHALTSDYDPDTLKESILNKAIVYLAAGIDPSKVVIFIQSKVKEHSELCWYLNTVTPVGELERMTQYKEKSERKKKRSNAGLLNYPILMAADILLYDTEIVPVGEDQKQHVELARDIARKFNNRFGETFKIPKAKFPKNSSRIMSLKNPENKMSKSGKKGNAISLFDSPEEIENKIMTAVTDTDNKIKYDPKEKAAISNLLVIYSEFKEQSIKESEKEFSESSYKEFKEKLAELLIESLSPFRKKKKELEKRREVYVEEILRQGAQKASNLASSKIVEVRRKMGLIK
jgi:tryptophanyl-tRNA synthetase